MLKVKDIYPLIMEAFNQNKTFTMPINGTSMQPLLHTGDSVVLAKPKNIEVGDIVFFKRDNDTFVLHRVYKDNLDGSYDIIGDHQIQIESNVKKEQIFAKVVAYKKNNKLRRLKGIRYKLYLMSLKSFFIRRVYIRCLH